METVVKLIKASAWIAAGLIVLLFLAIFLGPPATYFIYKHKVERHIAGIKAKGEPVTQAELKPPDVPDELNAAVVFEKIFEEMEKPEFAADKGLFADFALREKRDSTPGIHEDARKALARNARILPMVEEALARSECVFPVNWDAPFPNVEFRHLSKLRRVAFVLFAHAIISAEEGKSGEAVRSLELTYLLSETIKDDPPLTVQAVRLYILTTASEALQECTRSTSLDERHARHLYAQLGQIDLSESLSCALAGERAASISFYDMMRVNHSALTKEAHGFGPKRRSSHLSSVFIYADQFFYLRTMERWIELSREPYSKVKPLPDSIKNPKIPRYAVMTALLLPAFRGAVWEEGRARLAGDRILLALAAYRDRHGDYPESLGELRERLGWEIPEDPFSGEDFTYRREGNGFLLYSIGRDLMDDGGKTISKAELRPEPLDESLPPKDLSSEENAEARRKWRYTTLDGRLSADIIWRMER